MRDVEVPCLPCNIGTPLGLHLTKTSMSGRMCSSIIILRCEDEYILLRAGHRPSATTSLCWGITRSLCWGMSQDPSHDDFNQSIQVFHTQHANVDPESQRLSIPSQLERLVDRSAHACL